MSDKPKSKKINLFNRITFMLVIVIVQVGIIAYGIYFLQTKVSENVKNIDNYKFNAEEIARLNKTATDANLYLNGVDLLEDNFPTPENFEDLSEEIEALADYIGINGLTITYEEGFNSNFEEIVLSSGQDTKIKKEKYDGLDSTTVYIALRSNYADAINFINASEDLRLINNVKSIKMNTAEVQLSSESQTTQANSEYIETVIESIFYFRIKPKENDKNQ